MKADAGSIGTAHNRHILVADDDAVSRLTVTRMLASWGYRVVVAHDGAEALHMLHAKDAPLLAIIDWSMPQVDGIEVCRRLKVHPERRHAYVIVLTANNQKCDLVTALDAGADDFIGKPFHHEELRVRVRAGQRIVNLQRDLLRKASHDELTGIFNRRVSLEMLAREHARTTRVGSPLSVAMLDIDHFKAVNDSYGHPTGDVVLEEVAQRITASIRTNDLVGRYGGEEFVLIMPGCDQGSAQIIAERVRRVISATTIVAFGRDVSATVSIGVTTAAGAIVPSCETLLCKADRALYEAKRHGRNRVETA